MKTMPLHFSRSSVVSVLAVAVLVAACADGKRSSVTEPSDNQAAPASAYSRADAASVPTEAAESWRVAKPVFSVAPGPGQAELVVNGSFESNGGTNSKVFTGWTNFDGPGDPNGFRVQTGTLSPTPGGVFAVPAPPHGTYTAMSTQNGPGTHIISQVITLPAMGNGQLSFRLFIGNRAGVFRSPLSLLTSVGPNQQFRMDIMDPAAPITDVGAGVLMNVYQTKPGDPLVSAGYMTITANLSAFNGQTVRLRFAEVDNQSFFNAGVDDVSVIANVNQPPSANAGPDQLSVECAGATTLVQLDGTATDPDNNIVSIVWSEGGSPIATGEDPQVALSHGSHTLTLTVTDAFGLTATDDVTINVQDTTPPSVSLALTPNTLWSPNHKYVAIDLGLVYSDICDNVGALTVTATAVSSDPDDANGNGDGNTTGDVKAGAAMSSNANPVVTFNPLTDRLELRAERGGGSGDRTYTITVKVADSHGNTTTVTGTVTVPHNQ